MDSLLRRLRFATAFVVMLFVFKFEGPISRLRARRRRFCTAY
jgi:hypothetical protein